MTLPQFKNSNMFKSFSKKNPKQEVESCKKSAIISTKKHTHFLNWGMETRWSFYLTTEKRKKNK